MSHGREQKYISLYAITGRNDDYNESNGAANRITSVSKDVQAYETGTIPSNLFPTGMDKIVYDTRRTP